jgi:hypothetical protein
MVVVMRASFLVLIRLFNDLGFSRQSRCRPYSLH